MADDHDPAGLYARLRAETARMLGFDLASLSLGEGLQLDLTSMLRLEIDTLQGACLAGQAIDLARLQAAFAMLQKLLPTSVTETPPVAADDDDGSARRELLAVIEGYAAANEAAAAEALAREEACMADEAMAASTAAATTVTETCCRGGSRSAAAAVGASKLG
jgi:hypothetical protein